MAGGRSLGADEGASADVAQEGRPRALPVRRPCALEGTTRWQFGKVVKVYPGGELIDVDFDNGEDLHRQPMHDVLPARA